MFATLFVSKVMADSKFRDGLECAILHWYEVTIF